MCIGVNSNLLRGTFGEHLDRCDVRYELGWEAMALLEARVSAAASRGSRLIDHIDEILDNLIAD